MPFLAMELLQGKPLDEYLQGGRAARRAQAVRVGREAALGLAAAHGRGLVHRDIKPANLWLEAPRRAGEDARLRAGRGGRDDGPPDADRGGRRHAGVHEPRAGARRRRWTAAADLFSLGAVLYRLLTGRPPFAGATAMETLLAVQRSSPVPIRQLNPAVPEGLAALVHSLLAKKIPRGGLRRRRRSRPRWRGSATREARWQCRRWTRPGRRSSPTPQRPRAGAGRSGVAAGGLDGGGRDARGPGAARRPGADAVVVDADEGAGGR